MSNEELVVVIQEGKQGRMGELWEQVRRFVAFRARRVPLEGRADVDFDDLMQAGYLALVAAVADYEPENGAFLTQLGYRLKTAFAEATGFRSERQKRETLTGVLSLNNPLKDDADSGTLMDLVADSAATMERTDDTVFRQQLHDTVEAVLNDLPPKYKQIIRQRFYEGRTLAELAQDQTTTLARIRQTEEQALRELRRPQNACRLRPFVDLDYHRTGVAVREHHNRLR